AGELDPAVSEDEIAVEDEEDEDLVGCTAKEAAGALATIYAFIKPFLKNYKKMLAFVGIGVVIETLFNVIMPLSLKFLIDDALGEEDFQALYRILGVLAVAGIFTSIVAVWYERWDAAISGADCRHHPDAVFELAARRGGATGVSDHTDRPAHSDAEGGAGELRAEAQ